MNKRFCQFKGHEQNEVKYICTFKTCNKNRWICIDCAVKQINQHGHSQSHILKLEEFEEFLNNMYQEYQKKKVILNKIAKSLYEAEQMIQKQILFLQDYDDQNIKKNISKLNDILSIDNNLLNSLIYYQDNFQGEEFLDQIQKTILICQNTQNDIKNNFINQSDSQQKPREVLKENQQQKQDNFQGLKINPQLQKDYILSYEYDQIDQKITLAQVSPNEQYLAFQKNYDELEIIDIKTNKTLYNKQFNNILYSLRFSKDSQYIFVGDSEGYLYGYDIKNNLKQLYNKEISQGKIVNIFQLNNQILTCLSTKLIMIDIQSWRLTSKLDHYCQVMDYDQQSKLIVGGGCLLIMVINIDGKIILQKDKCHNEKINQVKFFNNTCILSCDSQTLKLWQIDYQKKELKLINYFYCQSFSWVAMESKIFAFKDNFIKILDYQFQVTDTIQHHINNVEMKDIQQIDSMNYIIILGDSINLLLYRQNKFIKEKRDQEMNNYQHQHQL